MRQRRTGQALTTLRYFDAAVAARHSQIPIHIAARFNPTAALLRQFQFAIYNALASQRELFVLQVGH